MTGRRFPHAEAALRALVAAFVEDGLPIAGIVVCAAPIGSNETTVMTVLRDDVRVSAGLAPSEPIMALLEQAARGVKNHMQTKGS
jgi:hypothetical protein